MNVIINLTVSYESEEDFTTEEVNYTLPKSTDEVEFSEKDLRNTIKKMTSLVKEAKKKSPFAIVEQAPIQLNEATFSFTVLDEDDKELEEYTEFYIFEEAVKYESLTELIEQYYETTLSGLKEPLWSDPDFPIPFGTAAVLNLAQKDKKHIATYIDFLKKNDLDHETEQIWHILDIINAHNWCPETLHLATARLLTCAGQGGQEQFQELYQGYRSEPNDYLAEGIGSLESYLKDQNQQSAFVTFIKQELKDYSQKFPSYFDNSLEQCIKQMNYILLDLEKYTTAEEMENIKAELEKIWKTAPKN